MPVSFYCVRKMELDLFVTSCFYESLFDKLKGMLMYILNIMSLWRHFEISMKVKEKKKESKI